MHFVVKQKGFGTKNKDFTKLHNIIDWNFHENTVHLMRYGDSNFFVLRSSVMFPSV